MNSLKRTLSLVLVLVMVLGLFGIAGAAYTDEAKIQYKEAVNVMTGIGAIEGDAGAFNPAGDCGVDHGTGILAIVPEILILTERGLADGGGESLDKVLIAGEVVKIAVDENISVDCDIYVIHS